MQHSFNTRTGECQFCRMTEKQLAEISPIHVANCTGKPPGQEPKPAQTFVSNVHPSPYYVREEVNSDCGKVVREVGFATLQEMVSYINALEKNSKESS